MDPQPPTFSPHSGSKQVGDWFAMSRPEIRNLKRKVNPRLRGKCLSVMRHLLPEAQHTSGLTALGVHLERGDVITGRVRLSEETGLSEKSARTCLEHLVELGELKLKGPVGSEKGASARAIRGTIYHIVNYNSYDGVRREEARTGTNGENEWATYKEVLKKTPRNSDHGARLGDTHLAPTEFEGRERVMEALISECGETLLADIKRVGFDFGVTTNLCWLLDFAYEHGPQGLDAVLTRVSNHRTCTSPAGLFSSMIRPGGLTHDQLYRLACDEPL